ncbi:hypothetical protein RZN25_12835 [Bacillaceae bacterium S4-13-56]
MKKRFFITIITIMLELCIFSSYVLAEPFIENKIEITFFALDDGEATLIKTNEGKTILLNTGSDSSWKKLKTSIQNKGVEKIDTLILSKQTKQTCGNISRALKEWDIMNINIFGSVGAQCEELSNFEDKIQIVNAQDLIEYAPGFFIRFLPSDVGTSMNLYIVFGNTSLLYLTYNDASFEKEFIKNYPVKAEIIKIPGYGEIDIPSSDMLNFIDPHMAILYNKADRVKHDALIEKLHELWIDLYDLEQIGDLTVELTFDDYTISGK